MRQQTDVFGRIALGEYHLAALEMLLIIRAVKFGVVAADIDRQRFVGMQFSELFYHRCILLIGIEEAAAVVA